MPVWTDVYQDFDNGSDTNGGTSLTDAIRTFSAARLSALPSENIRLLLKASNAIRPDSVAAINSFGRLSLSNKTNLIIQPYGSSVVVAGDVGDAGVTWALASGNRYRATVGTGLKIGGATYRYYENTTTGADGQPINIGTLRKATSAANCEATSWSWFYDSVGGTLDINLAGTNPAIGGVRIIYGDAASDFFFLQGMTNLLVQGINFRCFDPHASGAGYFIAASSCVNSLIQDCTADVGGYHNYGYLGTVNTGNVFRNVVSKTCGNVNSGGSGFVHFCSGSGISGGRYERCKAVVSSSLDPTGTPIVFPGAGTVQGYYTHGSTTSRVNDLEYLDCTANVLVGSGSSYATFNAFSHNDIASYTGTTLGTTNRPIRYIGFKTTGDTFTICNSSALFDRCVLNFSNAGGSTASSSGIFRMQKYATGEKVNPLFVNSHFLTNGDRGALAYNVIPQTGTYESGDGISFQDSSLVDNGTTATDMVLFAYNGKTNWTVTGRRSLFGFTAKPAANSIFAFADTAPVTNAQRDFVGNAYVGIGTGKFSDDASYNTAAEWSASVDTTATHLSIATAAFAAVGTDASVTAGSATWGRNGFGVGYRKQQ